MPDELWMEVHDIVYETGTRPSPRKRSKNQRKRERYTQQKAESREYQGKIRKTS